MENVFLDGIDLKEGQVFEARILKMMEDRILLELGNGKQIEAKTTIPFRSDDLSSVFYFTVKEAKENTILIRPATQSEVDVNLQTKEETRLMEVLKSLDLKPDKEKVQLVKELIKNNIPITKEIVQNLYQSKLLFNKIADGIQSGTVSVFKEDLNKDVPELIQDILRKLNHGQSRDVGAEGPELLPSSESSANQPVNKMIHIQNIDFAKLIFLFKNNIPINLENLSHLNHIVLREKGIAKQIFHLLDLLHQHDETSHLAEEMIDTFKNIKSALLEKQFQPEQIMKDIDIKLDLIKRKVENASDSNIRAEEILRNIEGLKKGIEFIRQFNHLNHSEFYLQLPIWLRHQLQDLDIYIYKNKKSSSHFNPKDCSILLILDTERLKRIKVFLKIREKSVECSFYTETEKIQDFIKKHQDVLKDNLSFLGFQQIHIRFFISSEQENVLNFQSGQEQISTGMHSIDLKV
ncbi:MAG TPA: hypothetical protein GX503_06480 [Clostridiales bacterium]|nr:hypothetical protein [Clostridiales bacterium]